MVVPWHRQPIPTVSLKERQIGRRSSASVKLLQSKVHVLLRLCLLQVKRLCAHERGLRTIAAGWTNFPTGSWLMYGYLIRLVLVTHTLPATITPNRTKKAR